MRKKAFTLTETLICMLILAILTSGISILIKSDSTQNIAKQDMDRLARWLNHAFARADRWKRGFYISVKLSQGATACSMSLYWNDAEKSPSEDFYADSRVQWTGDVGNQTITYNCKTHTVSPAFTLRATYKDGTATGESLTLSVRALVTRESS